MQEFSVDKMTFIFAGTVEEIMSITSRFAIRK